MFGGVFIIYIDFQADSSGKVVRPFTGLQHHGVCASGIGIGQLLSNAGVTLPGMKPPGDLFLIPLGQQSAIPC